MPRSASSAVDKALDLVAAVAHADQPQRLTELAQTAGLHRATAYRVLLDLVRRGWVMRVGEHYLPGPAAVRLSAAAMSHSLTALCRPILAALAARTGLMVNLQVLETDRSRVVDVVRPARLDMISDLLGEQLPVHRFAGPLALVATLDGPAREPYLAVAQEHGHSREEVAADLDRVRADGFAVERGRNDKLIASISRAVVSPQGRPLCAVTIVGPDAEFDPGRLAQLRQELVTATAQVSAVLGEVAGGR